MPKDKIITGIDIGSVKISTTIASVSENKVSVIGVSGPIPSKGINKGNVVDRHPNADSHTKAPRLFVLKIGQGGSRRAYRNEAAVGFARECQSTSVVVCTFFLKASSCPIAYSPLASQALDAAAFLPSWPVRLP